MSLSVKTFVLCTVLALAWAPAASAQLVIRTDTTISESFRAQGGIIIEEGATLEFDPHRSVTIESVGNVVVRGVLRIAPATADVRDTLRIVGADPEIMQGGHAHHPLETDRGLWVMDGGRLDIRGTPKTPWAPRPMRVTGWKGSDEIRIAPHTPGETETFRRVPSTFDWDQTVTLPSDRRERLRSELGDASLSLVEHGMAATGDVPAWPATHLGAVDPLLQDVYPEVFNLTRNVVIEGQPHARSHIFIHTKKPAVQIIKYAEIKYMGPRKETDQYRKRGTEVITEGVLSRYPLHFHMCGENSRGSQIEGVVVRHSEQRAFVPHGSHGITFYGTIAYDIKDGAYWWDRNTDAMPNSFSNDIVYDHAAALLVKCEEGTGSCYSSTAGFTLGDGTGNVIRNSVSVGVQGRKGASGFQWPESSESAWEFHDNIAHNNLNTGIFVWHNHGPPDHFIRHYTAYFNNIGVTHGAYGNDYHYEDLALVQNKTGIVLHASSDKEQHWKRVHIRGGQVGIQGSFRLKPPRAPVKFIDGSIKGALTHVALDDDEGTGGEDDTRHSPTRWHFVNWDLDISRINVSKGSELYEGAGGELLVKDYSVSPAVYRLHEDRKTNRVYTGTVVGPYYADYSTKNQPPYLIEMTSSILIEGPDGVIEFRGKSGDVIRHEQ